MSRKVKEVISISEIMVNLEDYADEYFLKDEDIEEMKNPDIVEQLEEALVNLEENYDGDDMDLGEKMEIFSQSIAIKLREILYGVEAEDTFGFMN